MTLTQFVFQTLHFSVSFVFILLASVQVYDQVYDVIMILTPFVLMTLHFRISFVFIFKNIYTNRFIPSVLIKERSLSFILGIIKVYILML